MSIVLDLIVVGIIILMAVLSARRGFVRTFVEVAGFFAAILIAVNLGSGLAGMAYDSVVGPKLVSITGDTASSTAQELLDKAWETLPDFIEDNADKFGISKDTISQSITENDNGNVAQTIEKALAVSVKPVFVNVFGMLCTVLLFIVLTFVVHILARALNKLFSFSLVGGLNRSLGAVIGVVKGAIFALIFCMVVGFIVTFSGGFLIFTPTAIDGSTLFKFLLSLTPFGV